MSDLPYTDEQIDRALEAARDCIELDRIDTIEVLRGFHQAGITVTFPALRYSVGRDSDLEGKPRWLVRDHADQLHVAWFYGDNAEMFAREHAARLNRRDGRG